MNLPTIDGRECVPVRLLPFMTAWQPLSPDVVARLFSRREEWRTWSISTYNLRPDEKHHELLPNAWDQIDDDLTVLAQELKTQESFEFQKYPEWRRRSVNLLPAAVFVWRDDLVADYARTYGRQKYPNLRPGAGRCTEEEADAELDLIIRLCRNPDTLEEADAAIEKFQQSVERDTVYRPGDGELNFEPLISAEDHRVAFKGFEFVLASSQRMALPDVAERHGISTATVSAAADAEPTKLQSVDKDMLFKRAALVAKHETGWPTIRSDLHSASENGLSVAAKAPAHGEWFEGASLAWAKKKGKLKASNQQVASANSVFDLARQVHRIEP